MRVVHCSNPECGNYGIEILWNYAAQLKQLEAMIPELEAAGITGGVAMGPYVCGPCGAEISPGREVPADYVPGFAGTEPAEDPDLADEKALIDPGVPEPADDQGTDDQGTDDEAPADQQPSTELEPAPEQPAA